VGSIVAAGGQYGRVATVLGFVAVVCAMTNVVGGFLITDRMLKMFKRDVGRGTTDEGRATQAGASGVSGDGRR